MKMLLDFFRIPYVQAAAMVFCALVVAKGTEISFQRIFARFAKKGMGFYQDLFLIQRPIRSTIIFQGFREAIPYLGMSGHFYNYADALLSSGIVAVWIIAGSRLSSSSIDRGALKIFDITGAGSEIIPLFKAIIRVLIIGTGLILILSIWNINITPLLASAGIAGVAVALAAKETLANFFGGVTIFIDRPFKIGDFILLENSERGEVVEIGIRSTRIKTRDDVVITIPNSVMVNSRITNESIPSGRLRLRIRVDIAYGSDIEKAEQILVQAARANARVEITPAPHTRFRTFGDSGLHFELLCWIKDPADKGLVTHELNKTIYTSFAEQGLTFPFPQRVVHIYEDKDQ